MEHLLHFIIKSRLLYASKSASSAPDEDEAFRKELGEVLIFFNSIMKISRPQFRGAQAMAVKVECRQRDFFDISSEFRTIVVSDSQDLLRCGLCQYRKELCRVHLPPDTRLLPQALQL